MPSHEVVDSVPSSLRAIRKLERETVIAVDAEGVNLGRIGPLTLLQIGTEAGHVYLFDVMSAPEMFTDGRLKELLESESIVKVMHSGRNDGEALYWQFKVELRGVFDTQVAQMVLDKNDGRRCPSRRRLTDVINIHCPHKAASMEEGKDVVHIKMNKKEGDYWAKRPMTSEMIEYAANDVIMLIPEVYQRQKSLLEEKGLTASFKTTIEQEILSKHDDDVASALSREHNKAIKSVLMDFGASCPRGTKFADVTDEEVTDALALLRFNHIADWGLPQSIADLKSQQMTAKMDDIENGLKTQGEDYEVTLSVTGMLLAWSKAAPNNDMKERAARLQKEVDNVVVRDIERKYTTSMPTAYLNRFERTFLQYRLRPKSEHDPSVPDVCRTFYWKLMMEELETNVQRYRDDPTRFTIVDSYVRKLRFYLSGPVPTNLKEKARDFLYALQDAGKITRPSARGQGRQQRGRYHRR